jgi:molecular chaperone DnaJ
MGSISSEDYYAVLGVDAGVDLTRLRRAWRDLALRWHPDRAGPAATEMFLRISVAYEVLSDPIARAAYDRRRRERAGSHRAPGAPPRRAPSVMLANISGSLRSLLACGAARHVEDDVIELTLGETDAAQGGMATISMPVTVRCPACEGSAATPPCAKCEGAGVVEDLFSAWLAVPPGVANGAVLAPSVLLRGMLHPVQFRIRVRGPASSY